MHDWEYNIHEIVILLGISGVVYQLTCTIMSTLSLACPVPMTHLLIMNKYIHIAF